MIANHPAINVAGWIKVKTMKVLQALVSTPVLISFDANAPFPLNAWHNPIPPNRKAFQKPVLR
jgi:hypothetical protein